MTDSNLHWLQRYRWPIAIGFWLLYFTVGATVESLSVITEYARAGRELADWEPFVWEFSSAVSTGLLIPVIASLNNRFRFSAGDWKQPLAVHLLATLPFSALHVGGMVLLRNLAYAMRGWSYDFGNLAVELPYEFRKDFVTYWFILGIIYLWQHLRFLNSAQLATGDAPSDVLRRVIARKRGREFVINVDEVSWIEAAGNYANLHYAGAVYPVRASMTQLEQRLDPERFARVHRSAIVNLDRIAEITPTDTGDHRIRLQDGSDVRLSRRYRAVLKDRLE